MANIFDAIFSCEKMCSLRYYGVGDLITGWHINAFLENQEEIKKYFAKKRPVIETRDDYIDYLFAKKIVYIKEDVDLFSDEKKKTEIKCLIEIIEPFFNKYNVSSLTNFINAHPENVFDREQRFFDLDSATLDVCKEYQTGLNDSFFMFLAKEHPLLLISRYEDFQKRIEKTSKIVVCLFETITTDPDCRYQLRSVLGVMKSIHTRRPQLFACLESANKAIIDLGISLAKEASEENVLLIERQFFAIYDYLNRTKHIKANEFKEYKEKIDKLVETEVLKNGKTHSFKIPSEKIKEFLKEERSWAKKLLEITHHYNAEKSALEANLNCPPKGKNPITDLVSTNRPTNEYFSFSHQLTLNSTIAVGGLTIYLMLENDDTFSPSLSSIAQGVSCICHIIDCNEKELINDYGMLCQMLTNVFYFTIADDANNENIMQSLCYGTEMFICAFIEKLLRVAYVFLNKERMYISEERITLGPLLQDENITISKILGEYQLKHLRYFLCTDNGDVGYNYRNRLAHLSKVDKRMLSVHHVCQLFYLLLSVINSLCGYFLAQENSPNE